MIIKVRTQINAQDSWSIFSNIKSVDYWGIKKAQRQSEEVKPDIYVQALDRNGKIDESEDRENYIWVTAIKEDDTVLTICSNLAVYLLNDEGKTIEHLS